jgi:hypothetical protein
MIAGPPDGAVAGNGLSPAEPCEPLRTTPRRQNRFRSGAQRARMCGAGHRAVTTSARSAGCGGADPSRSRRRSSKAWRLAATQLLVPGPLPVRQLLRESRAGGLIHADESQLSATALVFGSPRTPGHATAPRNRLRHRRRHDRPGARNRDAHRPHPAAAGRARPRSRIAPSASSTPMTCCPPRSARPSTCAPAPARYRESPKAPASKRCCATCAATSRSWSTSTAPSPGCSYSKTCSRNSSARSTTNSHRRRAAGPPPGRRAARRRLGPRPPRRPRARLTLDAPHETTPSGHLIEHLGRVPHPARPLNSTARAWKCSPETTPRSPM